MRSAMLGAAVCLLTAHLVFAADSRGLPTGVTGTAPIGSPIAIPPPLPAGTVVVGMPPDTGTGNCFPFGCAYSGYYQQVYTRSQFSGPIQIAGLAFFNTQNNGNATAMNTGNWMISLSTTLYDWNTITTNYAANLGADNTVVFNGNLSQPWAFGNTLKIAFSTPFHYDPSKGNLLLTVYATGTSDPGGVIYFDTNGYNSGNLNGNTIMGRVYNNGTGLDHGYGLVTGFIPAIPPGVTCTATPGIWPPPVGSPYSVSVLGTVTLGSAPIVLASYGVVDQYSQIEKTGSLGLGPMGGAYSVWIPLPAGHAQPGQRYSIVVGAKDAFGDIGSCIAVVTVP